MPNVMDDYITVAQRIERFYERYPEGSLQSRIVELTEDRVVMEASAYRSEDDLRPGIGYSSMPIPARNAMLRDSEIETCETSAWGRAIAALGFEVKKAVASRNEIEAKQREGASEREAARDGLIGIGEKGNARTSDYLLRETPDGHFLGFRLKGVGGKSGLLIEAHDAIAEALALVEESVIGKRLQIWGHYVNHPLKNGGSYDAYVIERISTPDFVLPAPDKAAEADAQWRAEHPAGAITTSDSPSLTGGTGAEPDAAGGGSGSLAPQIPASDTPAAADGGAPKAAAGLPTRPTSGMFDR